MRYKCVPYDRPVGFWEGDLSDWLQVPCAPQPERERGPDRKKEVENEI